MTPMDQNDVPAPVRVVTIPAAERATREAVDLLRPVEHRGGLLGRWSGC